MEQFLSTIELTPVLVSFVLAYGLGWYWYSDAGWGKRWREGKAAGVWQAPMWMPMVSQAGATFFLALLINIFMVYENTFMSAFVTLTIAGFIKANGLFAGKTKYAITVETMYVIVMGLLMIAVNMFI
ncbi:hypothetical protein KBA63_05280 [Candidatus Woesebacteria bacterium]|nr:hypothetical protein [Candidatus Woesebacteria bacterium]MBP9687949.1 hypothetical protein [Candidatus Woesebacteria bacterium]